MDALLFVRHRFRQIQLKDLELLGPFRLTQGKGVVFTLLLNDYRREEFWVDEMNCNNFTLVDLISMTDMLFKYFKTGKVFGFDEETNKPVGTVRINEFRRDSFKSNIKIIESSINLLNSVEKIAERGILNDEDE